MQDSCYTSHSLPCIHPHCVPMYTYIHVALCLIVFSLAYCLGKKTKPSVLKSFKKGPSLPSTQRRFSSEAAIRMFSLTNSPHSAARKAKPHTIPKHLRSKKQKKELSVSVGGLSHKGQDGESLGDMPSLSELLADGSLWDS